MRIFLTGATGYVGAAVLDALLRAEHDITALVRDNEKAARVNPISLASWRPEHEEFVVSARTDRVRTIVVRPGVVYGGGSGWVGDLFKSAANGLVRVVGDGNNHWPLVYDRDLADLYARL